jgi:hypothetical protein
MDYAGAANNLLPVQNVTFDYGADFGTTVAGNDLGPSGNGAVSPNGGNDPFTTQPNFGGDENDTNTAWICNTYMQANTADISFGVPTVNGQNYKLQLLFHDAFLSGSGKRVMTVTIGSQVVVPTLDLGALGCTINSPKGYVISYSFTGNGGVLPVTIHSSTPTTGPAILNGLTLEVLNGSEVPHFILAPQNQTQILGLSTTFSVLAAGGTNNAISYQWYYANAPITGATNNIYTLTNVTADAAGQYAVVASNSSGSATNTATLTVDTTKSTSLVLVTGPDPGEGLNLNGNMVMAQYFGNHTGPNLPIGGTLFTPSTITGGTEGGGNLPSFGPTLFDRNLATLSYYSVFAGTLDFTIPTTSGVQYRLQLILHDNFFDAPGSRIFNVKVGGNVLAPNLDLAALKAGKTNAVDVAVIYYFTGDGNPLDVNLAASLNNAMFCAYTLEDLSSAPTAPTILVPVGTQVAGQGATVQLSVSASGGGLSYQWQQMVNGTYVNLADGGNISGSMSNILTIAGVTGLNSTNFNVLVSNISGATNSSGSLIVLTTAPAMIGHWLAGGMNLSDSSGYAPAGTHDGFFVGDGSQVWSTDVPTNLASFAGGYSLDLSAGNAAVAITNTVITDPNYAPTFDTIISNSFSVAVWIKGWPLTMYDPFLSKKGENSALGAAGFQLREWYSYTYPTFTVQSGVGPELNNPNLNIVDSKWHHLVGTRNASTGVRNLYVDSVLVASFTNDFAPMPASLIDHLMLGGKQSDGGGYGNWAQVKLFDARMYNYALTLPQVSSLNGITNPPTLVTPVATQAVVAGDNVQFSVNASGIGLSYQWQKLVSGSYVNLTDGGNVSGSTSNILSLAAVSTSDDDSYQVIVSNSMGTTNASANLDVVSGAPGLVGHWLAGGMNLTDSSGFTAADTHDGFFIGDGSQAWSTDVPTNLPSFAGGYSLDLSAGSAAVAITNSATGDLHYYTTFDRLLTNNFTVAAWVKGWPIINYGAFVAKKGEATVNGTNGFQLRQWYSDPYPTFTVQSGVGPELNNTNINIVNAGWHHLVGTRDAATGVRDLYVDSVLVASYTNDFAALPVSVTDHLTLGAKQSDGNYGNWAQVKLFDVRVYNYQLTASQIQAVNGIVPPPPTPTNPTPINFSVANGQLTMNWTNGVLESTTNLAGNNWMIEVVSDPPVTIPISTSGNKFYRVISQ